MPVRQRQLYTECSGEITGNQETSMVLSVCKFVLGRKQNNQNCFSLPVPLQLGKRFWAWLLMGQSVHKIAGLFMGETPLKHNYLVVRNPWTKSIHRLYLKKAMYGWTWIWMLFLPKWLVFKIMLINHLTLFFRKNEDN